jgi:aryl-alcohol dehydrogenase-like predicted oxidoreductase
VQRQKVLIASKCGLLWNDRHETANILTKSSLLQEIDRSLSRLQTDYKDTTAALARSRDSIEETVG